MGYDSGLPDYGVLVTYIDEGILKGKGPARVQDSQPETRSLDDATFDLRINKSPVFLDKINDLALVIQQKTDLMYLIEITNFTNGQMALISANSLMRADQTISNDSYTIDLFGAKIMLVEAHKLYSIGKYEEAKSQSENALEAQTHNNIIRAILLAGILFVILVFLIYSHSAR